jgi:hypothetical protein
MFVIRYMGESDILFLQDQDPRLRIKYIEAYLHNLEFAYTQQFEQKIKDKNKIKIAQEVLDIAYKQLQQENLQEENLVH